MRQEEFKMERTEQTLSFQAHTSPPHKILFRPNAGNFKSVAFQTLSGRYSSSRILSSENSSSINAVA